jgi:acetyl esterase/lipase
MASLSGRAVAGLLDFLRVRDRVLDPARFTGPSARPRKPDAHRPPRSLSRKADVRRADFDGWPCYILTPHGAHGPGHILFLHGGAYAHQMSVLHWRLVARVAERTGHSVTIPIYPLTPEHSHREVFPTLGRLYSRLVAEHGAGQLTVLGDSAGGGMALALVQTLPTEQAPARLVLLSPWLDATMDNPAIAAVAARDPLLSVPHLRALGECYAGPDSATVPTVSPINGPIGTVRQVSLFTGTRDVLNPDAHRFRELALAHGVAVGFFEYEGMIHDWLLLPLPESRKAIGELAEIILIGSVRAVVAEQARDEPQTQVQQPLQHDVAGEPGQLGQDSEAITRNGSAQPKTGHGTGPATIGVAGTAQDLAESAQCDADR